ncbi:MAG: hypothetical protein QM744_02840 [Mesorhizobium sp.]
MAYNRDLATFINSGVLLKYARLMGNEPHVKVGLNPLYSYRTEHRSGELLMVMLEYKGEVVDLEYTAPCGRKSLSLPRPVDGRFAAYLPLDKLGKIDATTSATLLKRIVIETVSVVNMIG